MLIIKKNIYIIKRFYCENVAKVEKVGVKINNSLTIIPADEDDKYVFKFGQDLLKPLAYIQVKKSHSNLFMTLTDCTGHVIIVKTAAIVLGKLERRRRRKAPQTIENMITSFDDFFMKYNILRLKIVLRIRPGQYLNNIVKSLKARNISIRAVYTRRRLPFSFTRGRRKKY